LVRTDFLGRIADRDTRLLSIQVLLGVLRGHTEEEINEVNAPALARERGIEVVEMKRSAVRDYADLVRVTVESGEESVLVAGTLLGRRNRAHLLEVWGQRFNIQLEDQITVFRYRDMPGMIGRVGSHFGEHGINIVSAAVGRHPDAAHVGEGLEAVMVITTDSAVPHAVIDEIAALDGFAAGRTVSL
jgi:D-3-phosphoglycerate dehydrogenase